MQTIKGTNLGWIKIIREHLRGFSFRLKFVKENELPYRHYRKFFLKSPIHSGKQQTNHF